VSYLCKLRDQSDGIFDSGKRCTIVTADLVIDCRSVGVGLTVYSDKAITSKRDPYSIRECRQYLHHYLQYSKECS
jgi:hypothetical protein